MHFICLYQLWRLTSRLSLSDINVNAVTSYDRRSHSGNNSDKQQHSVAASKQLLPVPQEIIRILYNRHH